MALTSITTRYAARIGFASDFWKVVEYTASGSSMGKLTSTIASVASVSKSRTSPRIQTDLPCPRQVRPSGSKEVDDACLVHKMIAWTVTAPPYVMTYAAVP